MPFSIPFVAEHAHAHTHTHTTLSARCLPPPFPLNRQLRLVDNFVLERFAAAVQAETHGCRIKYRIPLHGEGADTDPKLSEVFAALEQARSLGVVEYSVSQPTLEQVFISIANADQGLRGAAASVRNHNNNNNNNNNNRAPLGPASTNPLSADATGTTTRPLSPTQIRVSPPGGGGSDNEDVRRLEELHERGVLSAAEFEQLKAKVLMGGGGGGSGSAAAPPAPVSAQQQHNSDLVEEDISEFSHAADL